MSKTHLAAILVLLMSTNFLVSAHADLSDLKKAVDNSQANPPTPPPPDDKQKGDEKEKKKHKQEDQEDTDSDKSRDNPFVDFLGWLWWNDNAETTYGNHPYAEGGFVLFPKAVYDQETGLTVFQPASPKNYSLAVDTRSFYLTHLGTAFEATLKGNLFRFIGPYLDNWTITDGSQILNGLQLGIDFSLFQSDFLSLSLFTQWQSWNGLIDARGATLGVEFQSFPIQPLSLSFKTGIQIFDGFFVGDSELEAGLLFGSWEFDAGWKWWELDDVNGLVQAEYNGPLLGAKFYF